MFKSFDCFSDVQKTLAELELMPAAGEAPRTPTDGLSDWRLVIPGGYSGRGGRIVGRRLARQLSLTSWLFTVCFGEEAPGTITISARRWLHDTLGMSAGCSHMAASVPLDTAIDGVRWFLLSDDTILYHLLLQLRKFYA